MQQIINFIVRYKHFLLYIILLTVSLAFTINSHSYHQSRFFNSSNYVSGKIYETSHNLFSYFNLGDENRKLIEENKRLRYLLMNYKISDSIPLDSLQRSYTVVTGKVIKNSYTHPRNYVTINKGTADDVGPDMGVVTDKGILGIVENVSENYATVQSILNEKSNINAKIKGTDHFGSLVWDAKNFNIVQLIDIPRIAPLTIGDTIVTGGMSSIFPENIPIGTIRKFDLDNSNSLYSIEVALFNDMTNIRYVYVVNNLNRSEIMGLESNTQKP